MHFLIIFHQDDLDNISETKRTDRFGKKKMALVLKCVKFYWQERKKGLTGFFFVVAEIGKIFHILKGREINK